MRHRTVSRAAAVITLTAVGSLVLSGCSTSATGDSHWQDAATLRASSESDSVPSLVEPDAQDIDLRVSQLEGGGTQLRWRSKSGIVRSDCTEQALTGASTAGAAWWPRTLPARGWTCGWWKAFAQDGRYYAWHDSATAGGGA